MRLLNGIRLSDILEFPGESFRLFHFADLLRELTEGLANFVGTPRSWNPADASEAERQDKIERVRRALSGRLQDLATARIRIEPLASWQEAYRRSGRGSGAERNRDVWRIYIVGAPTLREIPVREATEFVDRMRHIFREAVDEAGGAVL